ncbi:bifunctional 4-hydroxy-2-oxoglutarate aldolase/2-dehydro-3-deoxy-phosphogluconate aldolase [Aestuariispira insulae]|uniref:2-keto-3-deoxy-phosphogluconate aldolase n=1 Tax=Aestuariispira insulae TaxID=1461337 RepID=A0A3D9HMT4_9PROT|nr:bifunctional 4-hydroxy-2-oxoglutarate aldolase/2-dehydro-3-deoxy-phosphogluconate aldolase [Aestuariispira insulae]RED50810.1 2-keto-3-deoxy-phosphogluconate aldolase [Aestuariispira insulae]
MTEANVSGKAQDDMRKILSLCPIMPVVSINSVEHAVPLAHALLAGGARSIEVTLRTSCALAAIEEIADKVPDILVGAGTVLTAADFGRVMDAGAAFAISPGHTGQLIKKAMESEFPYLPAASTASEIMSLRDRGFHNLKLFPAGVVGGVSMLKAIGAPISDIQFCPTGGVNKDNAKSYLDLANVICVGGSWVAPNSAMDAGEWGAIEALMADGLQAVS